MKTATIALNDKIKTDSVIVALFGGKVPNIYPAVAGEPTPDQKSYPYIRYFSVPIVDIDNMRLRRDVVQYWVGDVDVDNVTKIIERLIYLLDDDDQQIALPVVDTTGTVKVHNVIFTGSVPIALPSQDNGVWEQGVTCQIIYTFKDRTKIWGAAEIQREIHAIDTLLI